MRVCYKHAEKPNAKSCPFCSKDYCEDCLLLVGKRKTVICKDCYTILFNKIKKSTIRRYINLLLGVIRSNLASSYTGEFLKLFFIGEPKFNNIYITWSGNPLLIYCKYY